MNITAETNMTQMGTTYGVVVDGLECGRLEISLIPLRHERSGKYREWNMERWVKQGRVSEWLDSTWDCSVFVYGDDGSVRGMYNPTVIRGEHGRLINFAWLLEATPENADLIVRDVIRMAENGITCY